MKTQGDWGQTEDYDAISLFYVIESELQYRFSAWFGNLTFKSKSEINKLVHPAMKAMGVREDPPIQKLFEQNVIRQARRIIADPSHVLSSEYDLLPSVDVTESQSNKKGHLHRYKNSLIPTMNLLDSGHMEDV